MTTSTTKHTPARAPSGLGKGGRALWRSIAGDHDLDVMQRVQLEEACRAKDRLDEFDSIIHGKGVLDLMRFRVQGLSGESDERHMTVEVKFDNVITTANATANLMKQLLAAMRLPDAATGKKPQFRGARGAQRPTVPGGNVSSLDRARAAKSGS